MMSKVIEQATVLIVKHHGNHHALDDVQPESLLDVLHILLYTIQHFALKCADLQLVEDVYEGSN